MKKLFITLLAMTLLIGVTGCSTLIPKPVELFQKKVPSYPVLSSSDLEKQREAAALAALRAEQALDAAIALQAPVAIVSPASDSAILSKSVSDSLGPPKSPALLTPAQKVAATLDYSHAKYNSKLAAYSKDIDKYAGKKIEGTGLISVPYFIWLGGVVVLVALLIFAAKIGWAALKLYGNTNPLVAVGTSGVSLLASELSKGFTQVIDGGEAFKNTIETYFGANSDISNRVLALFKASHQQSQDANVQAAIQQLTATPTVVSVAPSASADVTK